MQDNNDPQDKLAKSNRCEESHAFICSAENEFCAWCAAPTWAECHNEVGK